MLAVSLIAGAALCGCGPAPAASVCVPELAVSPERPKPGRIVIVSTTNPCPVPQGTRFALRIQPADARIPIAQARAEPSADGSFEVSITVPPTIEAGDAIAWISNYWEVVECPEGASCASALVSFVVAAP